MAYNDVSGSEIVNNDPVVKAIFTKIRPKNQKMRLMGIENSSSYSCP